MSDSFYLKGCGYINIIGKSECTAAQMAQYLISRNPNSKSWALSYAQIYLEEGEFEGVRGDGAWIQSCKETGNFKFTGGTAVTFDQNNFCGLGVTRKGLKGNSFSTPRLGIRAQIQHLKGYATSASLKNSCIDPRYKYISPKGKAPTFEELAGKWAVPGYDTRKASSLEDAMKKGIGYGFDIIAGIKEMKKIVISNNPQTEVIKPMGYTNSPLVNYTKISPNRTSPRNHVIDRLTVHCFVGQVTAQRGCEVFQNKSRNASCNYVIGKDGDIGLCVEEKDRSWCSSNKDNDMRAITFEVASDTKHPYAVTDAALTSLINLIVDICKRNGKKKVLWLADKNKTLAYNPKPDEMVMTVHRWFAAKACPGDYLYGKHAYIAEQVNKRLGSVNTIDVTTNTSEPSVSPSVSSQKYTYQGVDYSPVFNPTYYANKYTDLKKAFGTNATALFNHFCIYGMKERRMGCDSFNVNKYKEYYADLRAVFGNNFPAYYKHYAQFGYKEKRKSV